MRTLASVYKGVGESWGKAEFAEEDADTADGLGAANRLIEFSGTGRVTSVGGQAARDHEEAAAGEKRAAVLEGKSAV